MGKKFHKQNKFQNFPAESFGKYNWKKRTRHSCSPDAIPGELNCPILETLAESEKAQKIFNALALTELNGISKLDSYRLPIKMKVKKIFTNKIRSCIPAGTLVNENTDPALCCTGFINPVSSICQLPDFVDVSVYTNSNVSSAGHKLNRTLFDESGYIKNSLQVAQLACVYNMCASKTLAFGILISNLQIPGHERIDGSKINRFLEGDEMTDNRNGLLSLFNQGLKLNTHAYCVPSSMRNSSQEDVKIITCE